MADLDTDDLKRRMEKAVAVLMHEFTGLRTGRASAALLEPVVVHVYGTNMPINQVATISVPEPRLISIQVWDKANIKAVDKALREANLGLNPQTDGQLIRVPLPELTEQRRKELSKIAAQYAEQAKVAVRNVRRDGMDHLKKMKHDHEMSEDDHKMWHDEVQELTDAAIAKIDAALAHKQKDIMQI
jgi:ribosome recycling factor